MRAMNLDTAGIGLASLCIVHCLALPMIVALMPMLAGTLDLPEEFHLAMVLLALPLSGWALGRGFHHHRHVAPAIAGATGLALMGSAVAFSPDEAWETTQTTVGSLLLIAAHLGNWARGHSAKAAV